MKSALIIAAAGAVAVEAKASYDVCWKVSTTMEEIAGAAEQCKIICDYYRDTERKHLADDFEKFEPVYTEMTHHMGCKIEKPIVDVCQDVSSSLDEKKTPGVTVQCENICAFYRDTVYTELVDDFLAFEKVFVKETEAYGCRLTGARRQLTQAKYNVCEKVKTSSTAAGVQSMCETVCKQYKEVDHKDLANDYDAFRKVYVDQTKKDYQCDIERPGPLDVCANVSTTKPLVPGAAQQCDSICKFYRDTVYFSLSDDFQGFEKVFVKATEDYGCQL